MLWYKNLLETRSRFVAYLLLGTGICILGLWAGAAIKLKPVVDHAIVGVNVLSFLSLFGFMSLAGSGVRTQSGYLTMMLNAKSTVYTLSLPVSRCRLLFMRSALGLLEATVMSIVYAIFVWIVYLQGKITAFGMIGTLLAVLTCGVGIYFVATLLSTVLDETFYVWILNLLLPLLFLLSVFGKIPAYLDIFAVLRSPLGTGTIPWLQMAVFLVLSGVFLFASIKVVESQDY